jgi:hypothetical protein
MRALPLKLMCGPRGWRRCSSGAAKWPIRPARLTVEAGIREHGVQVEISCPPGGSASFR